MSYVKRHSTRQKTAWANVEIGQNLNTTHTHTHTVSCHNSLTSSTIDIIVEKQRCSFSISNPLQNRFCLSPSRYKNYYQFEFFSEHMQMWPRRSQGTKTATGKRDCQGSASASRAHMYFNSFAFEHSSPLYCRSFAAVNGRWNGCSWARHSWVTDRAFPRTVKCNEGGSSFPQ